MKVGSLFAGIGGFDLGFKRAGFEVAWCVEIDRNARAVLARRFPKARILEDVTKVDPHDLETVDVICGGFPCQDLSVAGKRAGLAGARSGLFHDAMRIVRTVRPRLLVLENVPGLLSSNRGLDFATVLREVGEGWDCEEVAWRVLDSQFFGVAQRRRRVFIVAVGHSRIGCAEEVLALAESSGGNPPTRGEAREGVAVDAARCADGGRWWDGSDLAATLTKQNANGGQRMPDNGNLGAVVQPFSPHGHYRYEASDQSATLQDRENRQGGHTHLVAQTFGISEELTAAEDVMPTIQRGGDGGRHEFVALRASAGASGFHEMNHPVVAVCVTGDKTHSLTSIGFDASEDGTGRGTPMAVCTSTIGFIPKAPPNSRSVGEAYDQSPTVTTHMFGQGVATPMIVRRLTPVECERLQGFPDGWTDIGTDKPTADSHRYKQLGNAVTVNVAEWIARRAHDALTKEAP